LGRDAGSGGQRVLPALIRRCPWAGGREHALGQRRPFQRAHRCRSGAVDGPRKVIVRGARLVSALRLSFHRRWHLPANVEHLVPRVRPTDDPDVTRSHSEISGDQPTHRRVCLVVHGCGSDSDDETTGPIAAYLISRSAWDHPNIKALGVAHRPRTIWPRRPARTSRQQEPLLDPRRHPTARRNGRPDDTNYMPDCSFGVGADDGDADVRCGEYVPVSGFRRSPIGQGGR
jgi:hypothetical protein